jgi:MMP 1-O-methyltransferase
MTVEGQITERESTVLAALAERSPRGTAIVEIGSYRGRSTVALALGSRAGAGNCVYAIDPHDEFTGVLGGRFGPEDRAAFDANIARTGVGELVSAVVLPSAAAAVGWEDRNVGLLLIDGDHTEEAVRTDVEAWLPHVVERGTVAVHDRNVEGVRRVIEEVVGLGRLQPKGEADELAWFEAV